MKKYLSVILLVAVLFGSLTLTTAAASEKLPELKPLKYTTLVWLNDSDSPTTHSLSYSIDSDLLDFIDALNAAENAGETEAFLKPYGLSDLFYTVQIDWALDNVKDKVSGWHYNAFWAYNDTFEGFGIDEDGHLRVSEWDNVDVGLPGGEMTRTVRILNGMPDDIRWNGDEETKTPGVKSQLNAAQYTYQDEILTIDLKKHTFYIRTRIVCVGKKRGEDEHKVLAASKWSETVMSGKNAKEQEAPAVDKIAAPAIGNLHLSDAVSDGNPVAVYQLSVPEELVKTATQIAATDGAIHIEAQARIMGVDDWTDIATAGRELRPGEHACPLSPLTRYDLPVITEDTPFELRCRYVCTRPGEEDIVSQWSDVISYGSLPPAATPDEPTESVAPDERPASSHICVYIGIGCAVIAAAAIIFIVIRRKRRQFHPTDSKT